MKKKDFNSELPTQSPRLNEIKQKEKKRVNNDWKSDTRRGI